METRIIKCTIKEIVEGRHYAGPFSIGLIELDFDLQLAGPLSSLSRRRPIVDFNGERLVFQLSISKEGRAIKLTDEEFCFFLAIIMKLTLACYVELLSKRVEKLICGKITRSVLEDKDQKSGVVTDENEADVVQITAIQECIPEWVVMLYDPKFDSKIAV